MVSYQAANGMSLLPWYSLMLCLFRFARDLCCKRVANPVTRHTFTSSKTKLFVKVMSVNQKFKVCLWSFQITLPDLYGFQAMNRIAVQSGSLPSWKNSPIKTVPSGLRKVVVKAEKPPLHKQQTATAPRKISTPADPSKLLKDVSSMFDDDGDRTETEDDNTERGKPSEVDFHDDADMRAMFFSPSQSVNNSFAAQQSGAEYFWDRSDVVDEEENYVIDEEDVKNKNATATVIERNHDNGGSLFLLNSAMQEASHQAGYSYSTPDPIDLQYELKHNNFLQEHITFLTNFDKEMNAHINRTQSSMAAPVDETHIDYEKELITKLDHYLQLPAGVLHAMVTRQHQDIVELGLFNEI